MPTPHQVQAIRPGSEPVHSLALIKVQGTDRSYRCVLDGEEYNAVLPALRCPLRWAGGAGGSDWAHSAEGRDLAWASSPHVGKQPEPSP